MLLFLFRRQRDHKPTESQYRALLDTVETTSSAVRVHLVNKWNGVKLRLEVIALQDNTVRIKVNELEPIKQRYEIPVGDVLLQEPTEARFVTLNFCKCSAFLVQFCELASVQNNL